MNLEKTRLRGRPRNRCQAEVREDGRIVGGKGWKERVCGDTHITAHLIPLSATLPLSGYSLCSTPAKRPFLVSKLRCGWRTPNQYVLAPSLIGAHDQIRCLGLNFFLFLFVLVRPLPWRVGGSGHFVGSQSVCVLGFSFYTFTFSWILYTYIHTHAIVLIHIPIRTHTYIYTYIYIYKLFTDLRQSRFCTADHAYVILWQVKHWSDRKLDRRQVWAVYISCVGLRLAKYYEYFHCHGFG